MFRLRFFRVLLPVLLLPFLVLLVLQLRPKPGVHNEPTTDAPGPRLEQMNLVEVIGGRRSFSGDVGLVRQEADGTMRLEGIRRLELEREDGSPLIVSADTAGVSGSPGERLIHVQGGVQVREQERGLVVTLPELEIDQVAGEARSLGAVRLDSPVYSGSAASVIYGLEDQPTRLSEVVLESADGGALTALRGKLNDGTRDVEFQGDVRLTRGVEFLFADNLRVWRDAEGRVQRVGASQGVSGAALRETGELVHFRAERLDILWDAEGRVERFRIDENASVMQQNSSLAANKIDAARSDEPGRWKIEAIGEVYAEGSSAGARGVLRADELRATVIPGVGLLHARASGMVDLRSDEVWAEAAEAVFTPDAQADELVLSAGPRRRARLLRGRTRVAAERIITDREGAQLTAEQRVEATLLAGDRGTPEPAKPGLFRSDQAVHFVAGKLVALKAGAELTFTGQVRGWQGDRTLSADRVFLDQRAHDLNATGEVHTRVPRVDGRGAVSQADYIEISAEELDYSERNALAIYQGSPRIRQAEGWMEARRLEIGLDSEVGGVSRIEAFHKVRLEYRVPQSDGPAGPVIGQGDRALYTPDDRTVLLFGEEAPATVRRSVEEGGDTTSGRVLRYRLDVGTLKVESGEQGTAKITTSGESG